MYKLTGSITGQTIFEDMYFRYSFWTFRCAPDVWVQWDEDLAKDIVETDSQSWEVDDMCLAKEIALKAMKTAWDNYKE